MKFVYLAALHSLLAVSITAKAAPQPPVSVFAAKASMQPIFNELTFPARVESRVNAIIRSEAAGAVTQILKPLGSRVRRGETVAIIKHTDPVYEYAPMKVIASVSGVVSDVAVTRGSLVNSGDPIVTLTDPSQLRVVIEVAALDLATVRAGLKGELVIAGIPSPLVAEVQGVSPAIDPMLGTASAELKIQDAKQIVGGMVGRVQFKVNRRDGFLVPDFAIVYRGEDTFLRLVKDGKAVKVLVKLGERRQGQVEILKGLTAGDVVVNRASRFVSDGAAVQVETAHD